MRSYTIASAMSEGILWLGRWYVSFCASTSSIDVYVSKRYYGQTESYHGYNNGSSSWSFQSSRQFLQEMGYRNCSHALLKSRRWRHKIVEYKT